MAVARVHIVILSLALSIRPFPWTVPARDQGLGPSNDRQVRAGEMPVHEVKPGKIKVVVEARGLLEAARVADLYCPVEGQSTILSLVPEGQAVKKGELVCELDSSGLRDQLVNQEIAEQRSSAAYLSAKLSREAAEIAVAEYVEGIFKQDLYTLKSQIAGAEAAIQKAEDRLERTQRARQRMSGVAKEAAKTPADIAAELDIVDRLESAEQSVQKERKTLELARAKLDVLEKYTREKTTNALKVAAKRKRTEELGKKEAWVLEKNKAEKLKRQIEACRIFAPRDGVVICANNPGRRGNYGRPQVEEGAMVRERQKIASVFDLTGPMQVNLKVPESKVDFVAPGLRATVTVDVFPLSTLPAAVASVAPLPAATSFVSTDHKFYTTKVRIEEGLPALRPGMTVRVEIKVSELDNVLTLPNASVVRFDGKDQVAVQQPDGGFAWRVVVLGVTNDAMTEVKSGLKSGDIVALKPVTLLSDAQKRQIAASPTDPARPPGENPNPGRRPSGRRTRTALRERGSAQGMCHHANSALIVRRSRQERQTSAPSSLVANDTSIRSAAPPSLPQVGFVRPEKDRAYWTLLS
jgi:multidrug efflux pump subunit AcrA (membrane-fusion protein)